MKTGAPLPRKQWDFTTCPPEQLWRCWSYEFGREVEWVKRAYASGAEAGFDDCGNWHCWRNIGELETGEFLSLSIIPGFPDVPFLEALKRARFEEYLDFRLRSVRLAKKRLPKDGFERTELLAFNWHNPDNAILRDLTDLLEEIRPYPPFPRRGRSERRRYEADLKALGAYRLLETMSASAAIKHTRTVAGQSPYHRESDWFTAKKRAAEIIEQIKSLAPVR
jgi:hypothetical protein